MKEEKKYIDELIAVYLAEGLDKDALKELKQWIAASPENESHFLRQQEIWFSAVSGKEASIYNRDKAFELFKNRVAEARKTGNEVRKAKRNFRLSAFWQYAAVVAALCLISYFSYWRGGEKVKATFAEIVVEAPLGSRTKLYLPDGTLVWLNAGSRMTYSQGFGVEERKVNLMGEGYFEVERNEELPFQVQTKALRVNVLGTKFNFRDYADDEEAIVSLLEGKVVLNNLMRKEKDLYLDPNDRVVLDKKSGKMQLEKSTPTNATEWIKGYLFFDEELLPDIIKELERSYSVKIDIARDTLREYRFYGNFVRREQSIKEVLDALAATGKMEYKMEGNHITLY